MGIVTNARHHGGFAATRLHHEVVIEVVALSMFRTKLAALR
jgi:hypothetical protein